jgi:hypothetical protein
MRKPPPAARRGAARQHDVANASPRAGQPAARGRAAPPTVSTETVTS